MAIELEGLENYRLDVATQIATRLAASKGGRGQIFHNRPAVNVEGGVYTDGTNATLTGFAGSIKDEEEEIARVRGGNKPSRRFAQGIQGTNGQRQLPRTPRRSWEESRRLTGEGLCLRCTQGGHKAKFCPKFRRAQAPRSELNTAAAIEGQREEKNF